MVVEHQLVQKKNMIYGGDSLLIRIATINDLDAIKQICDLHRKELGFVRRPALQKSIFANEILVAEVENNVVGFVDYHHRRDNQTTLYYIVVLEAYRKQNIARQLIEHLSTDSLQHQKTCIRLKCPTDLSANQFYEHLGFTLKDVQNGKLVILNIWELDLHP